MSHSDCPWALPPDAPQQTRYLRPRDSHLRSPAHNLRPTCSSSNPQLLPPHFGVRRDRIDESTSPVGSKVRVLVRELLQHSVGQQLATIRNSRSENIFNGLQER